MSGRTAPLGATSPDLSGIRVNATTQEQINELEASNIATATEWAYRSRKMKVRLLSVPGLESLHEKMFGEVWEWAGEFRTEELNIGVRYQRIQEEIGTLLGDVKYWLEHKTYSLDETCLRFHHGLTRIHPFKNGNGRFARLAANLLSKFYGGSNFTWGKVNLTSTSPDREAYIAALKLADDNSDYSELLRFARS